ncbi:high affinity immunoglobulin epsilon receptor subunit alpha [Otolemur garnettii]|uniref:high affinity immunoglobulin epsilon receptor subunit alpha n=1 Tax=Otolemur garnettii TaxID=30611 RepID=UPI0006444FAA|nr:high affinity immunoglobulin epsilon receptor subunit alpha [Otolemur garnettii]
MFTGFRSGSYQQQDKDRLTIDCMNIEAIRQSILSLNPQWNRIFKGENVTLLCNRDNFFEVNSTKWTHNGTILLETTSSLSIVNASFHDSGEYKCQYQNFKESKPAHLEVFSDWLLLQASAEVVTEGRPLLLRCHGWKDRNVYKVIYYKNGKALKYWYENHNISISSTTIKDSGTYHCEGRVQRLNYISEPLNITVIKAPLSKYFGLQFCTPLLVMALFAADTWLFLSTQQQFTLLLKTKETRKGNKLLKLNPKPDPQKN